MVAKGVKIEFIEPTLIRRMSKFIVCDPSVAKVYISKGLAKYVKDEEISISKKEETIPEVKEEEPVLDVKPESVKVVNTIFPSDIIDE